MASRITRSVSNISLIAPSSSCSPALRGPVPCLQAFHLPSRVLDGRRGFLADSIGRSLAHLTALIVSARRCFSSLPNALLQLLDSSKEPLDHVSLVIDLGLEHCVMARLVDDGD